MRDNSSWYRFTQPAYPQKRLYCQPVKGITLTSPIAFESVELTAAEQSALANRANTIDYPALEQMHPVGSYQRDLPVSLARMIENAFDWEHLPFVHPGSFAAIALAGEGDWGWRAKVQLPGESGAAQLIELLVDRPANAWVTTVVEGPGAGIRIHTVATAREGGGIAIDVRFLLPARPDDAGQEAMVRAILESQYARLYDEDEALMVARQSALDRKSGQGGSAPASHDFGPEAQLARDRSHTFRLASGSFVARYLGGRWIAHAAICPHMLGPLGEAEPGHDGRIACPWHGYRFSLADGTEQHGRCGPLASPPGLALIDGNLVATA